MQDVYLELSLGVMIAFSATTSLVLAQPSCLDENGNPVDSWVALKASASFNYYVNSNTGWTKSQFKLDQTSTSNGCVLQTAQQMYGSSSPSAIAIYNDDPSDSKAVSSTYAHAKGLLMTDANQGFWLIHSMPNWPDELSSSSSPGAFPADDYGQSIICITVSASVANTIAGNLMVSRPYIYSSKFDSSLSSALPQLQSFVGKKYTKTDSPVTMTIKSLAGVEYQQFAKSKEWAADLWDDLIAPYYYSPFDVETWRNGVGGRVSSICGSNQNPKHFLWEIYMVGSVQMPDGVTWSGTSDHSKWGISSTSAGTGIPSLTVSCVGDINRVCSQEKRGGGALCRNDASIWKAFNGAIASLEPCYMVNPCDGGRSSDSCYWCKAYSSPTLSPAGKPPSSSVIPQPTIRSRTSYPTFEPTLSPTNKAPVRSPKTPTRLPTTVQPSTNSPTGAKIVTTTLPTSMKTPFPFGKATLNPTLKTTEASKFASSPSSVNGSGTGSVSSSDTVVKEIVVPIFCALAIVAIAYANRASLQRLFRLGNETKSNESSQSTNLRPSTRRPSSETQQDYSGRSARTRRLGFAQHIEDDIPVAVTDKYSNNVELTSLEGTANPIHTL